LVSYYEQNTVVSGTENLIVREIFGHARDWPSDELHVEIRQLNKAAN
jgi:hypothetical protein